MSSGFPKSSEHAVVAFSWNAARGLLPVLSGNRLSVSIHSEINRRIDG